MRAILFAAFALASLAPISACSTSGAMIERGTVMETAQRIAADYAASWNATDMNRFGALYAPDARHVTRGGDFLRGRSAIVAAHAANKARYPANTRMVTRLEGARAITSDAIVAVMHLEYTPASVAQPSRLTLTLAKRRGHWMIAQAQTSATN